MERLGNCSDHPGSFGLVLARDVDGRLLAYAAMPVRLAAWYTKERPTFADAMALTRRCLWRNCHVSTLSQSHDVLKVPRSLLERLTGAVCYAA